MNRPPRTERFSRTPRSSHRPHNRHRHRPSLEALETLCLMSADLTVPGFTPPPTVVVPGDAFKLNWTVANTGDTATTGTWFDSIYYSTSPTFDHSAKSITIVAPPGSSLPLGAGKSYGGSEQITLPRGTAPGAYFLFVRTGEAGTQVESDTANNASAAIPITVDAPDLVVTQLTSTANSTLGPDDSVKLDYTVRNQGAAPTSGLNGLSESLYVSKKSVFDASAVKFSPFTYNYTTTALAPNATSAKSLSFTIPAATPAGDYYFFVATNAAGTQEETDSTNNVSPPLKLTVKVPDLTVTEFSSPSSTLVSQGSAVRLNVTVKNVGDGATRTGGSAGIFRSLKPTFDESATRVGTAFTSSTLAAGATTSATTVIGFPAGLTPTTYYLFVRADYDDQQSEVSEANNVAGPLVVNYAVPNLSISNATLSFSNLAPGDKPQLSYTVTNTGDGIANLPRVSSNPFSPPPPDALYISSSPVYDGSARLLTALSTIDFNKFPSTDVYPLAPHASFTNKSSLSLPADLASGTYYLFVRVDDNEYQEETTRDDNLSAAVSFVYRKPDLVVSNTYADNFPNGIVVSQGESHLFGCEIKNVGSVVANFAPSVTDGVYLSRDNVWDENDLLVSSRTNAYQALAPGDTYSPYLPWTIPADFPRGDYFLLFKTDINNAQPESNESNNVGVPVKFTITGTNTTPPAPGDLVVSSISIGPPPATQFPLANTYQISYTVTNQGAGSVRYTHDGLYRGTTPDFSDAKQVGANFAGPSNGVTIGPGASYSTSYVYTAASDTPPGTYNLFLRANDDATSAESSKRNNISAPVSFSIRVAKLAVTALSGPADAVVTQGESIPLTYTVHNSGDAGTGGYDIIYRSTRPTFGPDAVALTPSGIITFPGTLPGSDFYPLGPGESFTNTYSIALADIPPGDVYLFVKPSSGTVSPTPLHVVYKVPDLIVSATAPTDPVAPGQFATINYVIKNTGTVAARMRGFDALYLSTSKTFGGDATLVARNSSNSVNPIPAGGTSSGSFNYLFPATLPAGIYYFHVQTDSYKNQQETDETNNISDGVPINDQLADLAISDIQANKTDLAPNDSIMVTYTVTNGGNAATKATMSDGLYLSIKPFFDATARLVASTNPPTKALPLAAGGSYTNTISFAPPRGTKPGTYYLFARTDIGNTQNELERTNNQAVAPIRFEYGLPDLQFSIGTLQPDRIAPGGFTTLTYTVLNSGTGDANAFRYDQIYLTSGGVIDAAAIPLIARPNLIAPQRSELFQLNEVTFQIPTGIAPGSYRVVLRLDDLNDQEESGEANNDSAFPITVADPADPATVSITADPATGLETTRSGGRTSFRIKLNRQPTSTVTVPISSSDPQIGLPAVASLTFTPDNWSTTQVVTIRSGNSSAIGDLTYQIRFGPFRSADARFDQIEQAFTLTDVDDLAHTSPVVVISLTVNDGAAQRSKVNSLTLRFSSPATLAAGAITLRNTTDGTTVTPVVDNSAGDGVVVLTFAGDGIIGGSLADGRYTLTVAASGVSDARGLHPASGYSTRFLRLFGDLNGDGRLDNAEAFAFRQAFNTQSNDAGYVWYLDYDGDGTINRATDSVELIKRNRKQI